MRQTDSDLCAGSEINKKTAMGGILAAHADVKRSWLAYRTSPWRPP